MRSGAAALGARRRGAGAAALPPPHDRGFNQADDLARQPGLPVAPLLRRVTPRTVTDRIAGDARHENA
jgi:hypothetical protein